MIATSLLIFAAVAILGIAAVLARDWRSQHRFGDGARADKWNAWRFPTKAELDHGADPWDLVFVGSADFPEDAREMLPEQGGQVQEGLTGAVTSYVNEEHELAQRELQRARERAARKGGDAA